MNYMTPELLAKIRSTNDEEADAAFEAWDRSSEAYRIHLEEIRPLLPKSVLGFVKDYCLHDARVLTLSTGERPDFSISLQLDSPKPEFLELIYRSVKAIKFLRHEAIADDGKDMQWWQYDELELYQSGDKNYCQHSILLTGGWELQVRFRNLFVRRLKGFLSASAHSELKNLELQEAWA